jgi:3-dehydroquinate synthase II
LKEIWLKIPSSLRSAKGILPSLQLFDKLLLESDASMDELRGKLPMVSSTGGDMRLIDLSSKDDLQGLEGASGVVARVVVGNRSDQLLAVRAAGCGANYIVIACPDWKVIPWENLVAQTKGKCALMAEVSTLREAELALGALELGVDGLVVSALNLEEALRVAAYARGSGDAKIELRPARVKLTKPLDMGLRACVDTCDYLSAGEGILLGVQSSLLFLVEGEVHENPHVKPRPFRVNAGAVSNYVLTPGDETRYLSEVSAGEKVMVASRSGIREVVVGRVKIERRPLIMVEAELEGRTGKLILQDAETIRLVTPDGSRSVKELKEGDEVLTRAEAGGRHFGHRVERERIDER